VTHDELGEVKPGDLIQTELIRFRVTAVGECWADGIPVAIWDGESAWVAPFTAPLQKLHLRREPGVRHPSWKRHVEPRGVGWDFRQTDGHSHGNGRLAADGRRLASAG
jgi:hypothetical protein